MKKGEGSTADEMRPEYKRSDFKKLERGKFYEKVVASSNVVVLEPKVAKAFPNSSHGWQSKERPKMSDKTTHYSPVFYKELLALKNGFWYGDV